MSDTLSTEFRRYLDEHQHPLNRATHMIGIPLIVFSIPAAFLDLRYLIAGQVIGWIFQLIGHRIEGNKPAFLKHPISLFLGPLMVSVELLERLSGWSPAFARRARAMPG